MRGFIVMAMFVASLAHAAWKEHTEIRDLQLSADGVTVFEVDAGAGSLTIKGLPDIQDIIVKAMIRVPGEDADSAKKIMASDMKLVLDKVRDHARLKATFDGRFWGNDQGSIDLEVDMPAGLALSVNDGSGSIDISDVAGFVTIDDGSGSIIVSNVGRLNIDDGSGSIKVSAATGDVSIEDGSGGITVRQVGGNVIIDDGSGGIDVADVEHDVTIVDDGSGSLSISDVRGTVHKQKT